MLLFLKVQSCTNYIVRDQGVVLVVIRDLSVMVQPFIHAALNDFI